MTITQAQIRARGCRHFNGIQNDKCEAGVPYKQFLYENYNKFPCHPKEDGTLTGACPLFEFHTAEEIEAEEQRVAKAFKRFFANLEANICPHCGMSIHSKYQVGKCVYARPCGCRLYQGKL